jgi:hypothetical protein
MPRDGRAVAPSPLGTQLPLAVAQTSAGIALPGPLLADEAAATPPRNASGAPQSSEHPRDSVAHASLTSHAAAAGEHDLPGAVEPLPGPYPAAFSGSSQHSPISPRPRSAVAALDEVPGSAGGAEMSGAKDSLTRRPQRTAGTPRALVDTYADPRDVSVAEGPSPPSASGGRAGKRSLYPGRGGGRPSKLVHGGPCTKCGTTQSTLFRKNSQGQPLCNACGLRYVRSQTKQQQKSCVEGSRDLPVRRQSGDADSPQGEHKASAAAAKRATRNVPERSRRSKSWQRRLSLDEQRWCRYCGAMSSPQWRYIDKELACNACALRRHRKTERKDVRSYSLHCA